jgi:hypothetical protein
VAGSAYTVNLYPNPTAPLTPLYPTELAHADMTTLPKMDTSCTALSLIPTVNGNTVRSFSTHGHHSAGKERLTTVSRSDIRLISTF